MRARVTLLCVFVAAVLAGCGASTAVQETPGPPVALDEPGNAAALAPTATPTATATATTTPSTTSTTGTTSGSTGTTSTGSTGTTTTPSTGTQTGSTGTDTQPPPAGSDAQKFEDFCAQNPGAC